MEFSPLKRKAVTQIAKGFNGLILHSCQGRAARCSVVRSPIQRLRNGYCSLTFTVQIPRKVSATNQQPLTLVANFASGRVCPTDCDSLLLFGEKHFRICNFFCGQFQEDTQNRVKHSLSTLLHFGVSLTRTMKTLLLDQHDHQICLTLMAPIDLHTKSHFAPREQVDEEKKKTL